MPSRPAFARWLNETNDVTAVFLAAGQIPGLINLAGGLPEPSIWPVDDLSRYAAKAVMDYPEGSLAYSPVGGLPALRELLAERFSSPNLPLNRDNVMITTGGMQALELIGKVLLEPGGLIAAQTPAYLGALDAWRPREPTYRKMQLGQPGFDPVQALKGAQFGYTVPNFSNPSGQLVGLETRQALVAAAHQTGTWLIEDDPYGTLYYDGSPLPRMLDLSGAGNPYDGPVIYLGTVSKELAPGLRVGWVIADPGMIRALTTAKQGSDMFSSGLCQMIVAQALSDGLTDRILPDILSVYRARRDALCLAMSEHLSGQFDWKVPAGGMFVWATAKDPELNTDLLMKRALDHGVCISPGSVFDPDGTERNSIRVNFTLNPPEKLVEGVRRLAKAVQEVRGATAKAGA